MQIVPSPAFKPRPVAPAGPIQVQQSPAHEAQSTASVPIPSGLQDFTKLLPTTLLDKIVDHLPPPEADLLYQTSKFNQREIREVVRKKLKPEFRDCTDPVKLFKDPSKRLGHFIAVDEPGRFYLYALGIPLRYLMDKIQHRQITLAQALDIVSVNRAKLYPAVKGVPFTQKSALEEDEFRMSGMYVICGLLKVEDYLRLDPDVDEVLAWPGVIDHLDRGIITVAHLDHIEEWSARLLGCKAIAEALARGELPIEQILTARQPAGSILENFDILKYLRNGMLSLAQANQLRREDCEDLHSPNLQRYLDRGLLSMDQLLRYTSKTRRSLKVLPA